ncbi:hypothetical protein [Mycolicibacterium frederiksbergense]|uniref:hypothetical protein n=1 Tax=Mycolicibacterium frederiksbergense TaxID=117567 RepID=UPI00265C87B4|nr:hypothetical protein [Mycolicibacterium frederiksbergense]MDO0973785.1 hypothetical protein [Mycolicibacterium frederiksbergense]
MSDTTDTASTDEVLTDADENPEGGISDATPDESLSDLKSESDDEMFPRKVVEDLRQENGRYRQRAQKADTYAQRLHEQMVRATGKLADPTDLAFDEEHLDDPDKLVAAVDELLARKPHLATRRPAGDIGQGNRGGSSEPFSLLGLLKERT